MWSSPATTKTELKRVRNHSATVINHATTQLETSLYPSAEKLAELHSIHGIDSITRWVESAVHLALRTAAGHDVTLLESIHAGANSLVFTGVTGAGLPVVLKVPTPGEAEAEIRSVVALAGDRMPHLIAIAEGRGAYIMEHITTIPRLVTALEIRDLAHALKRPAAAGFETLDTKLKRKVARAERGYYKTASPEQKQQLGKAVETIADLIATNAVEVTLHGDLRARNLLRTPNRIMAIDPKPAIGDPIYDLAFYLAWREQDLPTVAEWSTVRAPRLNRWVFSLSVLEREGRDCRPGEREEIIRLTGSQ
jgi:hypothetical protein